MYNYHLSSPANYLRYKIVLAIALSLNLLMFFVELIMGIKAESTSLLADAVDFLGDSFSYGATILVLGISSIWSARLACIKSIFMGTFGLFIFFKVLFNLKNEVMPDPMIMGIVSCIAFLVNLICSIMLYKFKDGNANMVSVWLCTRNDLIANIMIIIAAIIIFTTQTPWADYIVGFSIGCLNFMCAWQIMCLARKEIKKN